MPNDLVLPVNAGVLPQGFCAQSYQDILNAFSNSQSVTFPVSSAGLIIQANTPSPDQRDKAWLQLDSSGRPVRLYFFAQGYWLNQHQCVPGFTMVWIGALPDFTVFDGGTADALTLYTGPMWQVATTDGTSTGTPALTHRFPLGCDAAGNALPTNANPTNTVINPGDSGGEEQHILKIGEGIPHQHLVGNWPGNPGINPLYQTSGTMQTGNGAMNVMTLVGSQASNPGQTITAGNLITGYEADDTTKTATAHNTMPPWFGVNFLQRTTRVYYSVT